MRVINIFKILVGISFLAVAGIIALNLASRSGEQIKVSKLSEERDPQKQEKKEKIDFYEARGDKGNLRIKAERHYMDGDENYHLEGNVEIVFFDKGEGEDIFLNGQEVIYDSEWTLFRFRDKAEVRFKDLSIDVTSLEYDAEDSIFRSDYPVYFRSERLAGSGQRMTYSLNSKKLKLAESVHLEMITNLSPTVPVVLEGDRFEFAKKGKQGRIDGKVRVRHAESWIIADSVDFFLTANTENIRSMAFVGQVKASLEEGTKGEDVSNDKKTGLVFYSAKREVEADEVTIHGFQDLPQIRQVQAKGHCVFSFISDSGPLTRIEADAVEFEMDKAGELQKFSARKQARVIEKDENDDMMRRIEGDEMAIKGNKNLLRVWGEKEQKARIDTAETAITALEITLFVHNNNLEADKDVKVIFNRTDEEGPALGFFAPDEQVFITTEKMRFLAEKNRFIFSGETKLWQQKTVLFVEELNFYRESENVDARGKIRASLPYKTEDGDEKIVEIQSGKMFYDSQKHRIHYEEDCLLRLKGALLKAQSVVIQLDQEKGDMVQIAASQNVVVLLDQNEGRGDEAVFEVKKDILVLTGDPVLIAKDKGKTEGAKLTFHISDGKITVENKDRERSITVIKS